jgi:hypothetical protein
MGRMPGALYPAMGSPKYMRSKTLRLCQEGLLPLYLQKFSKYVRLDISCWRPLFSPIHSLRCPHSRIYLIHIIAIDSVCGILFSFLLLLQDHKKESSTRERHTVPGPKPFESFSLSTLKQHGYPGHRSCPHLHCWGCCLRHNRLCCAKVVRQGRPC